MAKMIDKKPTYNGEANENCLDKGICDRTSS